MMNERIQVHNNYISAVSSLEHKKDLINRLKWNDTHNIPTYEAEMSRHMTLHDGKALKHSQIRGLLQDTGGLASH